MKGAGGRHEREKSKSKGNANDRCGSGSAFDVLQVWTLGTRLLVKTGDKTKTAHELLREDMHQQT